MLRLSSALETKSLILKNYIENGVISESDATVIAVCAGRLPFRFQDYVVPNIVRSVFGLGFAGVKLDIEKKKIVGSHIDSPNSIRKKSGSSVTTNLFFQKESVHVSAVLYSPSDWVNYPRMPGAEFILVHNPNANAPLAENWLRVGRQYWMKEDRILTRASTPRKFE